ncbi:rRNA maturation RNase YbeY [Bacillus massilinigeriensis]|uniref:rRNA maturation RNase YbeY n=1 Tax=Bacillus mediterraneensis TaxID=1805474 RepID=UPI0008F86B71|nr:rRNA maturation RNase YbeY [Bacillus mediterraneensis]
MRLEMDLLDEVNELTEADRTLLNDLLNLAAEMESVEEGSEVSVTIVSNERIREINREYRGKDAPTDVISFALEEEGEGEIAIVGENMPRVLGDIIISSAKAKEQAQEYKHSYARELGFLAVHGFLHLLGYDHMNKEDEAVMFSRQKEILDEFGLER